MMHDFQPTKGDVCGDPTGLQVRVEDVDICDYVHFSVIQGSDSGEDEAESGQMSHVAFIRRFTRLPDTLANRKAAEPSEQHRTRGGSMLSVQTENIGEMAVIQCEGRIVRSEAALKLRQAVLAQRLARIIVLDLSEVSAIEGGGLGMLVSLQRWAQDHDIRLKLFNPHQSVRGRLEQANSMRQFDFATLDEMMAILVWADRRYARAA